MACNCNGDNCMFDISFGFECIAVDEPSFDFLLAAFIRIGIRLGVAVVVVAFCGFDFCSTVSVTLFNQTPF